MKKEKKTEGKKLFRMYYACNISENTPCKRFIFKPFVAIHITKKKATVWAINSRHLSSSRTFTMYWGEIVQFKHNVSLACLLT